MYVLVQKTSAKPFSVDKPGGWRYTKSVKGRRDKRSAYVTAFSSERRNRHLAEWRFLPFIRTVTVYPRIWNVMIIGIASPPFGEVWLTACRSRSALGEIIRESTTFVNERGRVAQSVQLFPFLCSGFSDRKIFAGSPVFVARKQGTFCPLTPFCEGG